jgi:hypothetical protein
MTLGLWINVLKMSTGTPVTLLNINDGTNDYSLVGNSLVATPNNWTPDLIQTISGVSKDIYFNDATTMLNLNEWTYLALSIDNTLTYPFVVSDIVGDNEIINGSKAGTYNSLIQVNAGSIRLFTDNLGNVHYYMRMLYLLDIKVSLDYLRYFQHK